MQISKNLALSSLAFLSFGITLLPSVASKPSSSSSPEIPEMQGFSPKAKFSVSSIKRSPMKFCGKKLSQLVYLVAKKSRAQAERRRQRYLARRRNLHYRRRGRSVEISEEIEYSRNMEINNYELEDLENSDEILSANERMLMTSYNCQIQTEVFGIDESDECKAIVDFVNENEDVMMAPENLQSRSVRNTRKHYKYLEKINRICCFDYCDRDDEDEIKAFFDNDSGFRRMVIEKIEDNHVLYNQDQD